MMSGCSDMSLGHCPSSSDHHVRILEGIAMLLSRWHGLQLAIENQWGGVDSVQKSHQLIVDIFTWFSSRPKGFASPIFFVSLGVNTQFLISLHAYFHFSTYEIGDLSMGMKGNEE